MTKIHILENQPLIIFFHICLSNPKLSKQSVSKNRHKITQLWPKKNIRNKINGFDYVGLAASIFSSGVWCGVSYAGLADTRFVSPASYYHLHFYIIYIYVLPRSSAIFLYLSLKFEVGCWVRCTSGTIKQREALFRRALQVFIVKLQSDFSRISIIDTQI